MLRQPALHRLTKRLPPRLARCVRCPGAEARPLMRAVPAAPSGPQEPEQDQPRSPETKQGRTLEVAADQAGRRRIFGRTTLWLEVWRKWRPRQPMPKRLGAAVALPLTRGQR